MRHEDKERSASPSGRERSLRQYGIYFSASADARFSFDQKSSKLMGLLTGSPSRELSIANPIRDLMIRRVTKWKKLHSIVGDLIKSYVQSERESSQDCRIVVPVLTQKIAQQLHEYLLTNLHPKFLLTESPEMKRRFKRERAEKSGGKSYQCTARFFRNNYKSRPATYIPDPSWNGRNDSIMAFREDWPWSDEGSETFRLTDPF